jgi:ribosomal protein L11 methyltransferase
MFSLSFRHPSDELIAELWESGTVGIQEEEDRLRAFFEGDAASLMARFASYGPELQHEESRDWAHAWQDEWQPILAGTRFFLVPAWRDDSTPPGRLRLEMHPGQACGTGAHPATRLSLEALEKHLRPGATVLDIGTGSGILAVAASLLGARRVLACDIDPLAIAAARERGSMLLFKFHIYGSGDCQHQRGHYREPRARNLASAQTRRRRHPGRLY